MYRFILLVFLFIPLLSLAQQGNADHSNVTPTPAPFMMKAEASGFTVGGSSDMTGILKNGTNITGSYTTFTLANVLQGDIIFMGNGYIYEISVVNSIALTGEGFEADVDIKQILDVLSTGSFLTPFSTVAIARPTSTCGLLAVQSVENNSLPPAIQAYMHAYNMARIDSCIGSVGGGGVLAESGLYVNGGSGAVRLSNSTLNPLLEDVIIQFDSNSMLLGNSTTSNTALLLLDPTSGGQPNNPFFSVSLGDQTIGNTGNTSTIRSDTTGFAAISSSANGARSGEIYNTEETIQLRSTHDGRFSEALLKGDSALIRSGIITNATNHAGSDNFIRNREDTTVVFAKNLRMILDEVAQGTANVGDVLTLNNLDGTVGFAAGGGSSAFDSNRPIQRVPTVGTNIGGATVQDFLEWWYFGTPTISLSLSPSTTVYEVGTSNAITLSGSTSNPSGATLSNGNLNRTIPGPTTSINAFAGASVYSQPITFAPNQTPAGDYTELDYSFRAEQDYSGSESGTATSPTRSIKGVYPVLFGMSATDLSVGGDPYTVLTKLVEDEGDKTVTLTGTNEFMYYALPVNWSDSNLSQIIDHNGFDVTASFTEFTITINSSGLTNNWTGVFYRLYKLNTVTTATGFDYQFIR